MVPPRVTMFLETLEDAERRGDRGVQRAMRAELDRLGFRAGTVEFETAVPDVFERAVPRKGGRPKLPRCEHGRVADRCLDCSEDVVV